VCSCCGGADSLPKNAILFCDAPGCNLAVHQVSATRRPGNEPLSLARLARRVCACGCARTRSAARGHRRSRPHSLPSPRPRPRPRPRPPNPSRSCADSPGLLLHPGRACRRVALRALLRRWRPQHRGRGR
jgi:hypothetical protein